MQKTKVRLPILLIVVTVIAACFLRFFQLIHYTDISTGLVTDGFNLSYTIYGLLFLIMIISIGNGIAFTKRCETVFSDNHNRKIVFSSAFAALCMFADFVNQCHNCYFYVADSEYIEYGYMIPLGISVCFALVSSFYFMTVFITARGGNFDIKKLIWLHFTPIIWAVFRLISITAKFINLESGIEIALEFLFLTSFIFFWFSVMLSFDGRKKSTDIVLTVTSVFSFCLSAVLFLPEILFALINFEANYKSFVITSLCYMSLGIIALCFCGRDNS
ncbi:MAG: hypothetical protein NC213_04585 [Acetobacter sp.]|nr:hypothetical protein [Bacteroides sp.]MCM1341002.1 hypothetical protein [Acetobacter sp.]MCM1432442.1 hypothetical protein [Clostridiales bacterium]